MPEPMSEERLAFLKGEAVPDYTRGEFLDEALYEIQRLQAVVEELERQAERCECEKCFRCKDIIPMGNAIYCDSDGDPFCSRCWVALGRSESLAAQ